MLDKIFYKVYNSYIPQKAFFVLFTVYRRLNNVKIIHLNSLAAVQFDNSLLSFVKNERIQANMLSSTIIIFTGRGKN
jgi:hypothetical protein